MVTMIDRIRSGPTHVFEALERLNRRADVDMRRLLPPTTAGLRGSHGRILDLIDAGGSRPSALADGAWISKQAIGQRVRELEERGWVTVVPDPTDGRAVLVRRTAAGDRIRGSAVRTIAEMEHQWADQVGRDRYVTFREVLDELGG
jgi:DNA-binding MarR family transcriptional regulator